MTSKTNNLTPQQEAAIKHRGGPLLVSAAAGSGKTKVLVERLLDRVNSGDDIDEFLVITYTRAAAAELKDRILEEIHTRLEETPENKNLRRQSLLCRGASIDTIHGFCTDVLQENAHMVSLPPDFRVADESESDIIKSEILKDVLDSAYETIETSGDFRALIDMMAGGRDDRRIVTITLDLHAKLQSNPDPQAWAEQQIQQLAMDGVTDISETAWGARLMEKARRKMQFWGGEMIRLREEMRAYPEFENKYGVSVDESIIGINAFTATLDGEGGWDEAVRASAIDFPNAKPVSGYEELKDKRKRYIAAIKKCAESFDCSSEEHIEDMWAIAPAATALLRLVIEFDRAYSEEKRRRGVADFSDLEHLALSLLIDGATSKRTSLARAISGRFKEIMIDEYQDVNAVQEYIFNAVSQESGNIFMVGDVKQSIYRFRLADPTIFLEKLKRFKAFSSNGEVCGNGDGSSSNGSSDNGSSGSSDGNVGIGRKILLTKNFRSRAGILDAVNFIFSNIMSADFGEIEYAESEWLVPGRDEADIGADACPDPAVEMDVIDMSGATGDEDDENPVREQIEARHIARRISELIHSGYPIPDGEGGMRRVEYSDIVILLRSVKNKAWRYAAALAEQGIPVDLPGGEGFFETVEIQAALSLLFVIDNPMQDIALASALRGPVYGFTADELAEIRTASRGTDYYRAIVKAAESSIRCKEFLEELEAFRSVMPDMPADRFIWHVYNKTGLLGRVGALNGGNRRRSNLILLTEYARRFEQNGYKGLFGFLTYIRGLRERGAELSQEAISPVSDCVRVMSIHKSKGLEFPVVILADTSKRFNNRDSQQPLVVHPKLGVGATRTDTARRIEYPTIARLAVQSALTSEMMAEELRVLYVAMTRAREKLIITATFADAAKELEKLGKLSGGQIPPQVLEDTKSMSGWILLPILGAANSPPSSSRESESNGNAPVGATVPVARPSDTGTSHIMLRVYNAEATENRTPQPPRHSGPDPEPHAAGAASPRHSGPDPEPHAANAASPEDVELLRKRFSFTYPFSLAPELPSKLTVTGLKGRRPDYDSDLEAVFYSAPVSPSQSTVVNTNETTMTDSPTFRFAFQRPEFITKKERLTAAERGTALHIAMQYIDFQKCVDTEGVIDELQRLKTTGLLTEEQHAVVEPQKITRFFESDIGKRVLNAGKTTREFKFSLLYPAERFFEGGGEDEVLLQGVIDCFFEEQDELTVIDFKTDRVTLTDVGEKVKSYTPQLAAYAEALERITGKPVKERIIYFFALDESRTLTQ